MQMVISLHGSNVTLKLIPEDSSGRIPKFVCVLDDATHNGPLTLVPSPCSPAGISRMFKLTWTHWQHVG